MDKAVKNVSKVEPLPSKKSENDFRNILPAGAPDMSKYTTKGKSEAIIGSGLAIMIVGFLQTFGADIGLPLDIASMVTGGDGFTLVEILTLAMATILSYLIPKIPAGPIRMAVVRLEKLFHERAIKQVRDSAHPENPTADNKTR